MEMAEGQTTNNTFTSGKGRELIVNRVFNASRDLVFKNWQIQNICRNDGDQVDLQSRFKK